MLAHIEDAHGRVPFAVVSGSTRESVTASLTALGLLDRFETLVCAGDYTRAKPDPEGFLLAARRLGVAPTDCLVFEDTALGVQAATAAGMAAVRVPQHRILGSLAQEPDHAAVERLLPLLDRLEYDQRGHADPELREEILHFAREVRARPM
ncbi:HAD family hydrolase [Micromonospora sp. NPDC005806]|uniref:HAD family hydrolase n=1 Tax=Micromonospora sp. NPDC005806 TaxID=3364234 RepID=UPI0036AB3C4A